MYNKIETSFSITHIVPCYYVTINLGMYVCIVYYIIDLH